MGLGLWWFRGEGLGRALGFTGVGIGSFGVSRFWGGGTGGCDAEGDQVFKDDGLNPQNPQS